MPVAEVVGAATDEDLAGIVVKNVAGVPVRVADVAQVRLGSLTRYGGVSQDGKGEAKAFKPGGSGFYERLAWSPDSKRIAFVDNSFSLYVLEVASGATV